ncbi:MULTISPECIES: DUF3006 domain-containing protein [unclassified Clostridium]|uniref:DUF3006 domain-containing protein n=1 Tax=unclassified Clostridium TaxID=2614128 RepID=UPI0018998B68|nr:MULTISPECIES: DUF3006 domain-containing protein [unclassified Clostridium]MBO5131278.1 DUF3006 domain-containing protein [Romboutsia sp.]MBP3915345.1 DUF3006 domain-containing protein [Clostridium sp.]MEE0932801.1 DUF3006 domain-containing protein [Clostridium sp.]
MKDRRFIVDRIENKSVVLEDDKQDIILIDINLFDKEPKDGDVVVMCNNSFYVDEDATKERKNKINSLMKGMWEE